MGTQALDRALALLEVVARDDGRTPAVELVARSGLAGSTGRRMLSALERAGYLRRVGHGRLASGPKLAMLAGVADPNRTLVLAARPTLARLAARHGGTAHVGILAGDMVTYLAKEGAGGLFTREGQQLEAYCTGIGKALLAQLPDVALDRYLGGTFVRLTTSTLANERALRADILATRARGYAIDRGEMVEGLACLAVPFGIAEGRWAAISLAGGPELLARASTIVPALHRGAEEIAGKLAKLAS